jgi:hypothetical protein
MAMPTALVDQGKATATATASQSAKRTRRARSNRANRAMVLKSLIP